MMAMARMGVTAGAFKLDSKESFVDRIGRVRLFQLSMWNRFSREDHIWAIRKLRVLAECYQPLQTDLLFTIGE